MNKWICRNHDGETVCHNEEEANEMDGIWSYGPHADCGTEHFAIAELPLYKAVDSGERVNDVVIKLEYTRATKEDLIRELIKRHDAQEVEIGWSSLDHALVASEDLEGVYVVIKVGEKSKW